MKKEPLVLFCQLKITIIKMCSTNASPESSKVILYNENTFQDLSHVKNKELIGRKLLCATVWRWGYWLLIFRWHQRADMHVPLKHHTLQHRRNCLVFVCNPENYKTFQIDLQWHIFRSSICGPWISYIIRRRLRRTRVSGLKHKL